MLLMYALSLYGVFCWTEGTQQEAMPLITEVVIDVDYGIATKKEPAEDPEFGTDGYQTKHLMQRMRTRDTSIKLLKRQYRRHCKQPRKDSDECKVLLSKITEAKGDAIRTKRLHMNEKDDQKTLNIEVSKRQYPSEQNSSTLLIGFKDKCNTSGDAKSFECVKLLTDITQAVHKETIQTQPLQPKLRILEKFLCFNYDPLSLKWYDPAQSVCCNGLFPRKSETEECCRSKIIDTKTHFCCGNENGDQIYSRAENNNSDCCGTFVYNIDTEICCQGQMHIKVNNATTCCGISVYNPATHVCCYDEFVHDRSQGDTCCGNGTYNSKSQTKCCRNGTYNSRSQTCCRGQVQKAYGKMNRRGLCCGTTSYDSACYSCNDEEVIKPKFNVTEQICCDGRIKLKKKKNSSIRMCINGTVVVSSKTSDQLSNITTQVPVSSNHHTYQDEKNGIRIIEFDVNEDIKVDKSDDRMITTLAVLTVSGVSVVFAGVVVVYLTCRSRAWRGCKRIADTNEQSCKSTFSLNSNVSTHTINHCMSVKLALKCANEPQNTHENGEVHEEEQIALLPGDANNADLNGQIHTTNVDIDSVLNTSYEYCVKDNMFRVPLSYSDFEKKWDVSKDNIPHKGNLISDHFINCATQTGPPKECNRRTIFGRPFAHTYMLDESNSTVQMPNSDVKMSLPIELLRKNPVETHCSTFCSLPSLRSKLNITDDQSIASPVVEYALTGHRNLPDYARVVLPFIGDPDQLEVWKFDSDEGLSTTAVSKRVLLKEKNNTELDVYYLIEGQSVIIYTKSFSGFYCTTCIHRELSLVAFLFGSYKRFRPGRHEIRLMLYIADEVVKFKDYQKRMVDIEQNEGRTLKVQQNLILQDELQENDYLRISVTPTEGHEKFWMHKTHPITKKPIKSEEEEIPLKKIAQKCPSCPECHLQTKEVPYCVEWYLTNKPDTTPDYTFQCLVDVICVKQCDSSTEHPQTYLIIDELNLRPEDRIPFEESSDAQHIHDIKEYMSSLVSERQQDIVNELCSKFSLPGKTVNDVFNNLQQKLTPSGIYDAVIAALNSKHMFKELDQLQKRQVIPERYFPKPQQRVEPDTQEINARMTSAHRQPSITNVIHLQQEAIQGHTTPEPRDINPVDNSELGVTASPVIINGIHDNNSSNGAHIEEYGKPQPVEVVYCRTEFTTSRPPCSFSLRNPKDDSECTVPFIARDQVRRELETGVNNTYPDTDNEQLPVQENASMDETTVKITGSEFNDDDYTV